MSSHFELPKNLEIKIGSQLKRYDLDLTKSAKLAASVQKMSDFYIENPTGSTPWDETWAQIAQIVYYYPLNYLRNLRVLKQLEHMGLLTSFFSEVDSLYEFGAGLSPSLDAISTIATLEAIDISFAQMHFAERSIQAQKIFKQLHGDSVQVSSHLPRSLSPKNILVCSYSLTELLRSPDFLAQAEKLILLEPSTRQDGRALMELRQSLLKKGYHIWAPCTHQGACPLLNQSKTDWCHDRILVNWPDWFLEMESYLPFKNRSITLSYLVASKTPAPKSPARLDQPLARVIGDFLEEKGKARQLICRGPQREFLSVLTRKTSPVILSRGDLINIDPAVKSLSDELRYDQAEQIRQI